MAMEAREDEKDYVHIKHFLPRFFDAKNREVENDTGVFTIEAPRYQDVLDLVPYIQEGEEYKIVIVRSWRPGIALRARIKGATEDPLTHTGDTEMLWEVCGGYMRPEEGEASMQTTAEH